MSSRLSQSSLLDSGATSFVKQLCFLHPRLPLTTFGNRLSLYGRHDNESPRMATVWSTAVYMGRMKPKKSIGSLPAFNIALRYSVW